MKRIAMLAAYTLLGALASALAYLALMAGLFGVSLIFGGSKAAYALVSFLVVLSAGLFLGSGVTGYLSRPLIGSRTGLILVSPGFYPAAFMIITNVVMVYIFKDSAPLPFPENVRVFGTFLCWFLSSWAGTCQGASLRSGRDSGQ